MSCNYSAYYSANGGSSWTVASTLTTSGIMRNIVAAGPDDVAVVSQDTVAISHDDGATWTYDKSGGPRRYRAVAALDSNEVAIVGEAGYWATRNPVNSIPDYALGSTNWMATSGPTNGMFGVCLQAIGATTTAGAVTVDGNGTCTASDTDPWNPVTTAPVKFAKTTAAGAVGRADFVWGVRPGSGQAPGTYRATITVEALAPDA